MNRRKKPEREAIRLTTLWQKHGPNSYPINLDDLIHGAIQRSGFVDKLSVERAALDSIEGSLIRKGGEREWTIIINSCTKNSRRQRFTYAHELGHFMCHRDLKENFDDDDKSLNDFYDEIEFEANTFASWLLMPANLLRLEFGACSWKVDTLRAIGGRFECSLQASALRYVKLFKTKRIAFVVSRDGMIIWSAKSDAAPYMSKYSFGDELPENSHAIRCSRGESTGLEHAQSFSSWRTDMPVFESQYFDRSGEGYQYTCIEF